MTVAVRAERCLCVVRVQQTQAVESDARVEVVEEAVERRSIGDVDAGDEQVAGVEANPQALVAAERVEDDDELVERPADRPACTGLVVHDERLPEHGYELCRHHPRGELGSLSRRLGDDDPDRVVGIALRKGSAHAGERKQSGEANGIIFHKSPARGPVQAGMVA